MQSQFADQTVACDRQAADRETLAVKASLNHRQLISENMLPARRRAHREPSAFHSQIEVAARACGRVAGAQGIRLQLQRRRRAAFLPATDIQPHMRDRSEEHTSELQSLMRISYAVYCL